MEGMLSNVHCLRVTAPKTDAFRQDRWFSNIFNFQIIQFDAHIFSDGLVQPPTTVVDVVFFIFARLAYPGGQFFFKFPMSGARLFFRLHGQIERNLQF